MLAAASRCGARDVTLDGPLLRARRPQGNRALPVILSRLQAAGFGVESASVVRPTLEDVYLHYTGRNFAIDEDAPRRER